MLGWGGELGLGVYYCVGMISYRREYLRCATYPTHYKIVLFPVIVTIISISLS